jgi:hypothetical protein
MPDLWRSCVRSPFRWFYNVQHAARARLAARLPRREPWFSWRFSSSAYTCHAKCRESTNALAFCFQSFTDSESKSSS